MYTTAMDAGGRATHGAVAEDVRMPRSAGMHESGVLVELDQLLSTGE